MVFFLSIFAQQTELKVAERNMQVSYFQNDSHKSGIQERPVLPDTINSASFLPDTGLTNENSGSVFQDTIFNNGKSDSIPLHENEDNAVVIPEKKGREKISQKDTLSSPDISKPQIDTEFLDEKITPDSIFPDSPAEALRIIPDTGTIVSLSDKNMEEMLSRHFRQGPENNWIIIFFLLIFSILAWVRISYFRRVRQLFESFVSNRYISQLIREEFVFSHPLSIALAVVFFINGSFQLMQANYYFGWSIFTGGMPSAEATGMAVFFKFLLFLVLFIICKMFIIRISGVLFAAREEILEYLFNLFLFNNILGILLFPLSIGVVFATAISAQNILFFSGGLVLLTFIFRLLKCIYIGGITTKFSRWYIILYICALEILPLFIVIKVFSVRK